MKILPTTFPLHLFIFFIFLFSTSTEAFYVLFRTKLIGVPLIVFYVPDQFYHGEAIGFIRALIGNYHADHDYTIQKCLYFVDRFERTFPGTFVISDESSIELIVYN